MANNEYKLTMRVRSYIFTTIEVKVWAPSKRNARGIARHRVRNKLAQGMVHYPVIDISQPVVDKGFTAMDKAERLTPHHMTTKKKERENENI